MEGRTRWKWVSLGLLVLAVPVLVVLAGRWVIGSIGGGDPVTSAAGGSFGVLLLAFALGVAGWVAGCVVGPAHRRRAFVAAVVALAVGALGGVAVWIPVARQASRQGDLVADLDRLDRMLPRGYRLTESSAGTVGAGLAEPSRTWTAPAGAEPCARLAPVLTRWAGRAPVTSPRNRYGVCTFRMTRYGWAVTVTVQRDERVELTTSA